MPAASITRVPAGTLTRPVLPRAAMRFPVTTTVWSGMSAPSASFAATSMTVTCVKTSEIVLGCAADKTGKNKNGDKNSVTIFLIVSLNRRCLTPDITRDPTRAT